MPFSLYEFQFAVLVVASVVLDNLIKNVYVIVRVHASSRIIISESSLPPTKFENSNKNVNVTGEE